MIQAMPGGANDARAHVDARTVSTLTAAALTIADMVGIGVFTSLGFQVAAIPSAFAILVLWLTGGLVALSGALSYAELGAALPRSGGEYNFLSRIYHPVVGFMSGWLSATVGFAAPTALAAMALGSYMTGIVPGLSPVAVGLGVTVAVTLVLMAGMRLGALFQNVTTLFKVGLILALTVAGFVTGSAAPAVSFTPVAGDLALIASPAFAISLVYVLYAYSGWNAATYIAGEVRDPQRALPLSILAATAIVVVMYVALNASFLYATPMADLKGQLDVGLVAGRHILGDAGGRAVGLLICFGLLSSISALMWIGSRVVVTMGEDLAPLRLFARKTRGGVPIVALGFQLAVVVALILTQRFEAVLEYVQFSIMLCSWLTVFGVYVLRWREPDLPRPYRTWGYPLMPLVFLGLTAFMLIYLARERPIQSLAGLATMLAGGCVFFLLGAKSAPATSPVRSV